MSLVRNEYSRTYLITYPRTELNHIMDRDVNLLSGGELQRFAIGTVCVQQADVYVTTLWKCL
jgi:translation initiation factor RLI1